MLSPFSHVIFKLDSNHTNYFIQSVVIDISNEGRNEWQKQVWQRAWAIVETIVKGLRKYWERSPWNLGSCSAVGTKNIVRNHRHAPNARSYQKPMYHTQNADAFHHISIVTMFSLPSPFFYFHCHSFLIYPAPQKKLNSLAPRCMNQQRC